MSNARISDLRQAIAAEDTKAALKLLTSIRANQYPKALLRPVLSSCHPGLDGCFLDLDLVPPHLLLAPRLPAALDEAPLDSRRVLLTHGCDVASFVTLHLNEVLRGDRPLYDDLPAIDIHHYRLLVELSAARRSWLNKLSALECLSLEATKGLEAEVSALQRWRPSRHDELHERPWIWIQALAGQAKAGLEVLDFDGHGIRLVNSLKESTELIEEAASQLLSGGATYLLWNRVDPPPASWLSVLRGLKQCNPSSFHQISETLDGLQQISRPVHSKERSLLAIDACWLARRNPRQLITFFSHWLSGPRPQHQIGLQKQGFITPSSVIQLALFEGVLVVAASQEQVESLGQEELTRRATQGAVEGGFSSGIVLVLNASSGPTVLQQLASISASDSGVDNIVVFMGVDDHPAPGSWDHLLRHLSNKTDLLLCTDEELQWSIDPTRVGQRQFAAKPTSFRIISRGHLPGLVAVKAALLTDLELQRNYLSLHGLIKDIGLQWVLKERAIDILPQALLRRYSCSNPSVLTMSTSNQRNLFNDSQLLELDEITQRGSSSFLQSEGVIVRGVRSGSFELQRIPQPQDKVSVIIPFRDQAILTRTCVLSLLRHETTIPFEIILVDNGSTDPDARDLPGSLINFAQTCGVNVIGIRDDSAFNFSALNNRARQCCSGNFLLFLNNDIIFESSEPLKHLLDPFAYRCTGVVSSRLLYEDGTIQHQGLVAAAVQSHDILSPGKGLRPGTETAPFTPLILQEEWSAATAACMVVRSKDFDRIGGFDETFSVAYNDVDLCWRLVEEGLSVIVTPKSKIVHAESKSRGEDTIGEKRNRLAKESGILRRRYPRYFHSGDPLYHCFLHAASHRFEPAEDPVKSLRNSNSGLIFSWTNPDFQSGSRPFIIYVHWDAKGSVRADIFEQLAEYRRYGDVAFVSASPALLEKSDTITRLKNICDVVIVRHNEGYDFGSWQTGLMYCERYLEEASHLILANDSCYGPLHSFDSLFARLMSSRADVVGLTNSTTIKKHLQSYFISYGRRVLSSSIFWSFWRNIQVWPTKVDLVRAYEVGWSDILTKSGFILEALYLEGEHGNVTHTHWRELIEDYSFPFIKTELLRVNPILQDIVRGKKWHSRSSSSTNDHPPFI